MSGLTLYRNDGDPMLADGTDSLEYIAPGVVLLYADTDRGLLCSYFEGRLGRPIQGTAEIEFADAIELHDLRQRLVESLPVDLRLSEAGQLGHTNDRWALDGLSAEPLSLSELEIDVIGDLVGSESAPARVDSGFLGRIEKNRRENHATERLDFAVGNVFDGARSFRRLVEAFADADVTVALSKAGRIEALEETDIVIDIDDSKLDPAESITAVGDTQRLIETHRETLRRRRLEERFGDHVATLQKAYTDESGRDDTSKERLASDVLRREFNDRFGPVAPLRIVDLRRFVYTGGVVVIAVFLFGFLGGVLLYDAVLEWAETVSRSFDVAVATFREYPQFTVQRSAITGRQVYAVVAAIALIACLGTAILRQRRLSGSEIDRASRSVRSDLFLVGLDVTIATAFVVFLSTALLFWIGT